MAKVIMFSRVFPKYHPDQGKPTYFVEKILTSINKIPSGKAIYLQKTSNQNTFLSEFFETDFSKEHTPKHHTIRAGHRFKKGDYFSPRSWVGKPYRSKQIILADDVLITSVFDFEMDLNGVYSINGKYIDEETYPILAQNDGLTEEQMMYWFMPNYDKPIAFSGQIICWNPNINY